MKKSVSSISLEELHLLAQKSEKTENLSKLMEGVESDSESQKDDNVDENGVDEHYTMENLVEENQTLHQQNEQMKKQIEDLRHLLLQVFSDTRSMLLTEDTIQTYLPKETSPKGSDLEEHDEHDHDDHEEEDHEEDHEEHDEHDDIEDFSTDGPTSNKLSHEEESKSEKSPEIVQEGHQRKEPDIDLPEGEIDSKSKKLKKKNKKTKTKKTKINHKHEGKIQSKEKTQKNSKKRLRKKNY